jgi:hypothetical protein
VLAHVLSEDVRQGLDDPVVLVPRKAHPNPHSAVERDRCPIRSIDIDGDANAFVRESSSLIEVRAGIDCGWYYSRRRIAHKKRRESNSYANRL